MQQNVSPLGTATGRAGHLGSSPPYAGNVMLPGNNATTVWTYGYYAPYQHTALQGLPVGDEEHEEARAYLFHCHANGISFQLCGPGLGPRRYQLDSAEQGWWM